MSSRLSGEGEVEVGGVEVLDDCDAIAISKDENVQSSMSDGDQLWGLKSTLLYLYLVSTSMLSMVTLVTSLLLL